MCVCVCVYRLSRETSGPHAEFWSASDSIRSKVGAQAGWRAIFAGQEESRVRPISRVAAQRSAGLGWAWLDWAALRWAWLRAVANTHSRTPSRSWYTFYCNIPPPCPSAQQHDCTHGSPNCAPQRCSASSGRYPTWLRRGCGRQTQAELYPPARGTSHLTLTPPSPLHRPGKMECCSY